MKKIEVKKNDELMPEYDLKTLKVRKLGPGRTTFFKTPDLKETRIESILQTTDQEDTPDEPDLC